MAGRFGLKNIEVNTSGISIDWDDGHRTTFDPMRLRLNCGCAECAMEVRSVSESDRILDSNDICLFASLIAQ